MSPVEDGVYRATIPGADVTGRWDLMYYFQLLLEGGEGMSWPSWEHGQPYFVCKVVGALRESLAKGVSDRYICGMSSEFMGVSG